MTARDRQEVVVRRLTEADIDQSGDILFEAFNQVFARHGYPPPVHDADAGRALARAYFEYEAGGCFVAVLGHRVIGSAFLHRRADRAGIGPVTVDPEHQGRGVGRKLMERLIEEASGCASIRLYQDAFNRESFALYVRMGFEVKGLMAILRAEPPRFADPGAGGGRFGLGEPDGGRGLREILHDDLDAVRDCDLKLTGFDRPNDLDFLWLRGPSRVIENNGRITGYAVSFMAGDTLFVGPAAAPDAASLLELTAAVCAEANPKIVTIRAPAEPGTILSGLLDAGFVVRSLGAYMVLGDYEPARGAFLASLFPETL